MDSQFGRLNIATPQQLKDFLEQRIDQLRTLNSSEIEDFQRILRILNDAIAGGYTLDGIMIGLEIEAGKSSSEIVENVIAEAKEILLNI